MSNKYPFLPARNQSSTFFFSFLLIFPFFNFRMQLSLGKTPASFPTRRIFDTTYFTLATTFSVVCVLFWLFFPLSLIRLLSLLCHDKCVIQLTHICHLSNIPELKSHVLFSNFRIESWRRRTPVSIPTRRA